MNRAYALTEFKSLDDDQRLIQGVASTPSPDRMGDIVEPKGAKYKLPLPLLAQHDHHLPIGLIHTARVSDKGIEIEAEIKKDTGLDYIETTWKQIKAGLVRGLSIGFRALDYEFLKNEEGIRFKEWEWLELSAVTVPAQAQATITNLKSYDQDPSMRSIAVSALSARNQAVEQAAARIERAKAVLGRRKQ